MTNCRITTDLIFEIYDVTLDKWFPVYITGSNEAKLSMSNEPDEKGVAIKIDPNNFPTVGAKNYRITGSYFQILNIDTKKYHTIWIEDSTNPKISISKKGTN
jgi:hypothetical protein